jgi:septal ring factor EnvC (AmiA/AmiB activator)
MTETSAIEVATRRLAQALDALESAVDRRREADRGTEGLAAQLHSLVNDRSKLAADLDAAAARARGLETTNREVARRLEAAIETIRSVLAANED